MLESKTRSKSALAREDLDEGTSREISSEAYLSKEVRHLLRSRLALSVGRASITG